MRTEQSINHKQRVERIIHDLFSQAYIFKFTAETVSEHRNKIFATFPKRTPQWVKSYCDGVYRTLWSGLYKVGGNVKESALIYGGYISDKFYSTHINRADYYGNVMTAADFGERATNKGHYWGHDTSKPWSCLSNK